MNVPASPPELDEMLREAVQFLDDHQAELTPDVAELAAELRRRAEAKDYIGLAYC